MGRITFRKFGCGTALQLAFNSGFLLEEQNVPFSFFS